MIQFSLPMMGRQQRINWFQAPRSTSMYISPTVSSALLITLRRAEAANWEWLEANQHSDSPVGFSLPTIRKLQFRDHQDGLAVWVGIAASFQNWTSIVEGLPPFNGPRRTVGCQVLAKVDTIVFK
jgi:hypothetical protein